MGIHARPLLTIADLDSMAEYGNRYELIEGELFVSGSVNGAKEWRKKGSCGRVLELSDYIASMGRRSIGSPISANERLKSTCFEGQCCNSSAYYRRETRLRRLYYRNTATKHKGSSPI